MVMHKTDTGESLPRLWRSGKAPRAQESTHVGHLNRSPKFRLQLGERSLYTGTASYLTRAGGIKDRVREERGNSFDQTQTML